MDYFEYPSTVAMLLREIRYGINLGLTNITIDPFMIPAHTSGHTSARVRSEGTVADESASGWVGLGSEAAAVVGTDYHFHVGDINVDYLPGQSVTMDLPGSGTRVYTVTGMGGSGAVMRAGEQKTRVGYMGGVQYSVTSCGKTLSPVTTDAAGTLVFTADVGCVVEATKVAA